MQTQGKPPSVRIAEDRITELQAEVKRLRAALKDAHHFFLGHFDDDCEECRRGAAVIETALKSNQRS